VSEEFLAWRKARDGGREDEKEAEAEMSPTEEAKTDEEIGVRS
jgi:hypothetical protein